MLPSCIYVFTEYKQLWISVQNEHHSSVNVSPISYSRSPRFCNPVKTGRPEGGSSWFMKDMSCHIPAAMLRPLPSTPFPFNHLQFYNLMTYNCRSQWPSGLKVRVCCRSLAGIAGLNPAGLGLSISQQCFVLSKFSATVRSLVLRSPTDSGASLCVT